MALNYELLMHGPPAEAQVSYCARDTMLYALGIGAASSAPLDPGELRFVFEGGLLALPTMAVVLGRGVLDFRDPRYGIDWRKGLHGEQSLTMHKPLPPAGKLTVVERVTAIHDKGPGKGAILHSTRTLSDANSGELIATLEQAAVLRGDGGFGGTSSGAPRPYPVPEREADTAIDMPTRIDQALLYRLSGDYNPLHADPRLAQQAGFERPILHGLCSFGITARGAVRLLCGNDPARLRRFGARFSAPVYPGETLRVEVWREAGQRAALRVKTVERGVTVLDHGHAQWA